MLDGVRVVRIGGLKNLLKVAFGWSSIPSLWGWQGNRVLGLMQQGTLCLLHSGGAEDAFQPLVHLGVPATRLGVWLTRPSSGWP
jgi:hypothetical protein